MRVDLHTHSNVSDGSLSPLDLVQRAKDLNVTTIALTDHDTVQGIEACRQAGEKLGIKVIAGVEISTLWEKKGIHIVGLNVDENDPSLNALLTHQQRLRVERAEQMSEKLAKMGIEDVLEEAKALTHSEVSRAHFARVLVERGVVSNEKQAFKRYLSQGKAAFVATPWCSIEIAVKHIHQAGGLAVVAHPLRYQLSRRQLCLLLDHFKAVGGDALEVAGCNQRPDERQYLCRLAKERDLLGSVGSDFHFPCSWRELGKELEIVDSDLLPIWHQF